MNEATFTFRVDENLKDQFTAAAKDRDRTGAQLIRDFMRDFVRLQQETLTQEQWIQREVQAGIDAANTGDVISSEAVEAEAAIWREEIKRKMAGAKA